MASVTPAELKLYGALNCPDDDTSTVGGAINASNEITDAATNEAIKTVKYNPATGAHITNYYKIFFKNTNSGTDLTNAEIWIDNLLITPAATALLYALSSSSSDNSNYRLKVHGNDIGGVEREEYVTLNGTSQVSSVYQYQKIHEIIKVDADGNTSIAVGDITIKISSETIGKIPVGYYTANGQVTIGLAPSLNDSTTSANRLTCPQYGATPIDLTFSEANSAATALAVANGGTLTFGSAQGIWIKRVAYDGVYTSPRIQVVTEIEGETV